MIDTPKNLTRNILVGLILGFVVGAFLFYTNFFPSSVDAFVEKYIFKMGGDIFMNLLKLLVVPLVFFSLVTGISSLGSSRAMIENTIYVVRLAPIARTFFFTTLAGLVILEKEL